MRQLLSEKGRGTGVRLGPALLSQQPHALKGLPQPVGCFNVAAEGTDDALRRAHAVAFRARHSRFHAVLHSRHCLWRSRRAGFPRFDEKAASGFHS